MPSETGSPAWRSGAAPHLATRSRSLRAAYTHVRAHLRYAPVVLFPARDRKAYEPALFPPSFATVGTGGKSARHAHHTMHLVMARRGTLSLTAEGTTWTAPAFVTAPDVPHAIEAEGRDVVLVFVDPESDEGERLAAGVTAVRTFDEAARDQWIATLPSDLRARGPFDRWVFDVVRDAAARAHVASPAAVRRRAHPRVRRLVAYLRAAPVDADTSIAALASQAGLSESRLTHAFRDSVGIPLRAYLLWQKLQRSVVAMSTGMPLSHAAAEGGFADAAHMSRTFRRMFGMSASAIRDGIVASARESGRS